MLRFVTKMDKEIKIAFDLDGVIYDMVNPLDNYFEDCGFDLKDKSSYNLPIRYGINEKLGMKHLEDFGHTRPFRTMPLIEPAKDKMFWLAQYFELYVITHRDWTPYGIEDTIERIEKDKLPVKPWNIIFSKEKGDEAKRIGINVFYEDCLGNGIDILDKSDSQVVLVDAPYNQTNDKRFRRVKW